MDKSMQRNPFWEVIKDKTPLYGFKYDIIKGQNKHDVIIHGLVNGMPATLKFPFPRICRSLSSIPNFTSKYINFLRRYTKEVNFISPDPRFQQPPERKSTFVQKLNLEQPKKVLTTPKTLVAQIHNGSLQVMIPPHIPNSYVGDIVRRKDVNEPVSDTMVLAMFIVSTKELPTVLEVVDGTAKFLRSKPCPMRLLPSAPASVPAALPVAEEIPAVKLVVEPIVDNVIQLAARKPRKPVTKAKKPAVKVKAKKKTARK